MSQIHSLGIPGWALGSQLGMSWRQDWSSEVLDGLETSYEFSEGLFALRSFELSPSVLSGGGPAGCIQKTCESWRYPSLVCVAVI